MNVSNERSCFPTIRELRRLVKKRERPRFTAMWFLEPIQVYFTYVLIRIGLKTIHVLVLWLLVALGAYAVTAIGSPLAFIGGALLIYLKAILDGSDGEIARYRKQFVSPEEDLTTFIDGVYVDEAFHTIEKPLWGLALALGLYRMTGAPWIFAPGLAVAVFHSFSLHNVTLQKAVPWRFSEKVAETLKGSQIKTTPTLVEAPGKDPIIVRVMDKLVFFLRNGKRFNLFVLLCATFDLVAPSFGLQRWGVWGLLVFFGTMAPLMIAYVICRTVSTGLLTERAMRCGQRFARKTLDKDEIAGPYSA